MITVEKLLKDVDTKGLQRLGRVHSDPYGGRKFCNTKKYSADAVGRAIHLSLHEGPRLDVLDVGCAFGYFVRACRMMGHNAEGLDLSYPMYEEACDLLTVAVHRHSVTAAVKLPPAVSGYDVINMVGFGLPFSGLADGKDAVFDWGTWAFFINDLLDRLRPNGLLAIVLNHGETSPVRLPDWLDHFGQRAAVEKQSSNRFYLRLK